MNPFKNKTEKKAKPRWAYTIVYGFVLIMLVFWLHSIIKPKTKDEYQQKADRFTELVDSTVNSIYGKDGTIIFRAEPAEVTYEQIPDDSEARYKTLQLQKDYMLDIIMDEDEKIKILESIENQMRQCEDEMIQKHSPDEIRFIVQRIRINIADTCLIHAFAKVAPDYSGCEMEVSKIDKINP